MENKIYHLPVQIYYEDTDFSGVVYHPNFLKYFERAREHVIGAEFLASLWDDHNVGFAVYKSDLVYQDGVEFADIIDVRTSYTIDGAYRTLWHQEVWRPNATRPAVIADIQMICMGKDKKLAPMPDAVVATLATR